MATITQTQNMLSAKRLPEDIIPREPRKIGNLKGDLLVQEVVQVSPDSPDSLDTSEVSPIDTTPKVSTQEQTQNALIINATRKYEIVLDFPAPRDISPTEVVIRNYATGLNHIDWKSVDYNFCLPELPWITGREMAGVVEEVGTEVSRVKKGDRVWTSKSSYSFQAMTYFGLT